MKKRRIYVVGDNYGYANWMQGKIAGTMEEADVVLFTGGADIDSSLYGEISHPQNWGNKDRDAFEVKEYKRALQLNKPMWGTCRGLQLFCAMNGGRLIQHLNHPGSHSITLSSGEAIRVNSLHHQACYPFELPEEDYKVLGWTKNLSSIHEDGLQREMNPPKEIESMYFPYTRCGGVQFHPEMMDKSSEAVEYCQELLTNLINDKL